MDIFFKCLSGMWHSLCCSALVHLYSFNEFGQSLPCSAFSDVRQMRCSAQVQITLCCAGTSLHVKQFAVFQFTLLLCSVPPLSILEAIQIFFFFLFLHLFHIHFHSTSISPPKFLFTSHKFSSFTLSLPKPRVHSIKVMSTPFYTKSYYPCRLI